MFRLDGRVAIVTGAAQGLGRAMAEGLAEAGASVVVYDLDVERGEAAARGGGAPPPGGGGPAPRACAPGGGGPDPATTPPAMGEPAHSSGGLKILVNTP